MTLRSLIRSRKKRIRAWTKKRFARRQPEKMPPSKIRPFAIRGVRVNGNCIICEGPIRFSLARWYKNPKRQCYYNECLECGFIQVLQNPYNYKKDGFTTKGSTVGPRVGKIDHQGREYHMATLGVSLLNRQNLDVMILGGGVSQDWRHIADLSQVREVVSSDLENFNDSPHFVPLDDREGRTYDLAIACEVAEHFSNPVIDIGAVCNNVGPNGLAVLSTNIYDRSDMRYNLYVYLKGHISYYTPEAFLRLGDQNGMFVDFRPPVCATQTGGPRKRYVLMSRNPEVIERANWYFSKHMFAPSEILPS